MRSKCNYILYRFGCSLTIVRHDFMSSKSKEMQHARELQCLSPTFETFRLYGFFKYIICYNISLCY